MKSIFIATLLLFGITATSECSTLVMNLTDYETGNTAVFDIDTGTLTDNVLPHHQDSYIRTDGSFIYIIEGFGADNISKYAMSDLTAGHQIYQYSVGENTNPHDIVFFDSKAYVLLYGSDKILVVNPNAENVTEFKTGEIDISDWADTDGSPEAHMGFVYNGMVYVVLQMYDLTSYTNGTAFLLTIDPSTNTIVDMDDETEGIQGTKLLLKNPQSGSLVGNILYLGCTTYGMSDEGVMTVDLNNPNDSQKKIVTETDFGGSVAGIDIYNQTYGLIYTYDENWNKTAKTFNPQDNETGEFLPVPDAGGGAVLVDGLLYIASRDFEKPGLYVISPFTDENPPLHEYYPTELPPDALIFIDTSTPSSIAESVKLPDTFTIKAAYPNPFNPFTTISFTLTESCNVNVDVFNISGQKIHTLVNAFMNSGVYTLQWKAASFSTGLYYIRVSDGVSAQTIRATFIK
ncbi:MAG: T9SS type A sorting domain-containing protein [Candidatus Latescibacteria bacterium]|nr:T9SS type A sorting domain-containing protein [Candidatus Latescibacterota bacterium]